MSTWACMCMHKCTYLRFSLWDQTQEEDTWSQAALSRQKGGVKIQQTRNSSYLINYWDIRKSCELICACQSLEDHKVGQPGTTTITCNSYFEGSWTNLMSLHSVHLKCKLYLKYFFLKQLPEFKKIIAIWSWKHRVRVTRFLLHMWDQGPC